MCKSCILGFVAFLGCISSIIGVSQLVIVVLYYNELPPIFLVLSLVTGTFVFTLSNCVVGSIITMIRTSVHLSGKIGVILALCSMCTVTTIGLLLLLLQCHWLLDQKASPEIGPFQLHCLKSVSDISEGIFLLIMTNSVTLGLSLIALLPTCFWEVRIEPDVFQISFVSSNWVYENNSENTNNASEDNIILAEQSFKQSRRFGNSQVQIPKVSLKSTRRNSYSSNSKLLRNISSLSIESSEQPQGTFADVLAAIPHTPFKQSEKTLIRLTSFCPSEMKKKSEIHHEQPSSPPERNLSESNYTVNNTSTLKCTAPLNYPGASAMKVVIKPPPNADDISHWLKKGKWRKESAYRTPATRVRSPSLPVPNITPPPWIASTSGRRSESNGPQTDNKASTSELLTPKRVTYKLPDIANTPPNTKYHYDIKAAISSLDNVLHLTPSVSTASYRHSDSPHSHGSSSSI